MQRVTSTKSKSLVPQYSFQFLAATAYDLQYNIAYRDGTRMVPFQEVYGKDGYITFTTISMGPVTFFLMVKK